MDKPDTPFRLVPIRPFDARRGYSRWVARSVGALGETTGLRLKADLWVDPRGRLVARFSGGGHTLHFRIKTTTSDVVEGQRRGELEDFLFGMLLTWVACGLGAALEADGVECGEHPEGR